MKSWRTALPVEEFSHAQYSALPSVEWQQRGRKHGPSFARLHHRRTKWRSAVSLGRRSETCGNSPSYFGSVWTEHRESTNGLRVGGKVQIGSNTCYWWRSFWLAINIAQPKSFFSAGIQKPVERCNKCIVLQGDYVEKWYVKLLTVTSIKAVKCILTLLFDSPSYLPSDIVAQARRLESDTVWPQIYYLAHLFRSGSVQFLLCSILVQLLGLCTVTWQDD